MHLSQILTCSLQEKAYAALICQPAGMHVIYTEVTQHTHGNSDKKELMLQMTHAAVC